MKMKKGWHCPHCSQICSRYWNMKVHIQRKHLGIGGPAEAPSDSGFIQNMNYPENMNGYSKHNPVFPFARQTKRPEVESHRSDRRYGDRSFLAEQIESFHDTLEMKNLMDSLQKNNRQITGTNYDIFLLAAVLSAAVQSKNFSMSQRVPNSKNNKPLGFCINVCEKCLQSIFMQIWPADFIKMKFSFKIGHNKCSEEDISRINHLVENKKIVDIPTKAKEIRDSLLYLLTEIVYLWAGKENIGLYALEVSPNIFSQEFRDNNTNISQRLDILASPWIEGNCVDLGYIKNDDHWAYKLIKQKDKILIINKDELREFLNTSNSTLRAFKAEVQEDDGRVVTRYFHVMCIPTGSVNGDRRDGSDSTSLP